MDIKAAIKQIEGTVQAYLSKDEQGLYRIPFEMQRPIIMLGPPGLGKTAVVAQVAERMGLGFVSYSITHHTRQSALGLPYIVQKEYGGKTYSVSEYTMSEILASVYDVIEGTGIEEGILFLDEVNCVSETLAPALLQFIQYKTFGQHRLPKGWVIVAAGNPPEYNKSAREFDSAMMDRLKRIDVEPSFEAWKSYAHENMLHPAVITYLDAKPSHFYQVRADVQGTRIVTARGWEDISRMIRVYEHEDIEVDYDLIIQYLQDKAIAEDFMIYYELFKKYSDDYKITEILAGGASEEIVRRAQGAPFDERVVLIGLLQDALVADAVEVIIGEEAVQEVRDAVVENEDGILSAPGFSEALDILESSANEKIRISRNRSARTLNKRRITAECSRLVKEIRSSALARANSKNLSGDAMGGTEIFETIKTAFNEACDILDERVRITSAKIDAAFVLIETAFGQGQEALIFVASLSAHSVFMRFIALHGNESFTMHNKSLLFNERKLDLLEEVRSLDRE